VLVIAGRRYLLFRSDGTLVSDESFARDGVHFAAVYADGQRFAISEYLSGVGDPSYLEEERIVVCDAETGVPVASEPSEALPTTQS
jgi:hypothetical protein